MTDILCNWLNNDVKLSKKVEQTSFARDFSNGYLIGETLNKYQLQYDFDQFSLNRTCDAQLNNFMRLEPVLHLLGVSYDTNVANDVMTEKHGAATKLMYEVFIALNKKQKANLTGTAMETMRPAAPVKLEAVESKMYQDQWDTISAEASRQTNFSHFEGYAPENYLSNYTVEFEERLKRQTPRQTDLNLEALMSRYHSKQIEMEQTAFKERFEEEQRQTQMLKQKRQDLLDKYKNKVQKQSEVFAKIQAATVHIPKPPANKTARAIQQRRDHRRILEADMAEADIAVFEEKLKRTMPPTQPLSEEEARMAIEEVRDLPDEMELVKPTSNSEYINKISKRLNEDAQARQEREKRRRKVLVDQLNSHTAQEEAHREEMLVNRLMRQSQQERRIAVQLLQARQEKETIKKNRLMREKQYEQRRLAEFEEALNRENEMAKLAKLDYKEQTQKDLELHEQIMAERAEARYNKHYHMAEEIMLDIVDYSSKIGEYRELTNSLLPAKLLREWTALFVAGHDLYEPSAGGDTPPDPSQPTPQQILQEEKQQLLDEGDFEEYRQMMGEWSPPENTEMTGPPRNNPIVGHIVQRIIDIVNPPSPPPPPPEFPAFPIKACVVGKVFSGKSSVVQRLADTHRLERLCVDDLVQEALEAHSNGEIMEVPSEADIIQEAVGAIESSMAASAEQPHSEVRSEVLGSTDENKQQEEAPSTVPPAPSAAAAEKQDMEQQEKSDPEKPVVSGRESTMMESMVAGSSSHSVGAGESSGLMLSARARLGGKAAKVLKKGKPLDDPILIEILIEAIKRIPEGTGWVMDGFPSSYNQAKMLEKALSGYEALSKENSKVNLSNQKEKEKEKGGKGKKSQLAPDPKPTPTPAEPGSGINVVILFDLPNELCLKRSAGRYYTSQSGQDFHQEFHPPPAGSATGVGSVEKVLPVVDPAHDQEQIQTRITAFQDSWPKMEKWFQKFGSLTMVDAAQELETVYLETENILEETLKKLEGPPEPEVIETEPEPVPEPPAPEPEPEPEPPKEEPVEERSRPGSKKGSRKSGGKSGSGKRSGSRGSKEKEEKKDKKGGKSPDSGGKKSAKGSRASSGKSPKRGKSGKGKRKTPEPEPEPEPEPPGTPPPQPGSDEWEYVDQPIDLELANILAPYWEAVENTYIGSSKTVFRRVRDEREDIVRYFFQIRKDFLEYLRRPDHKQEFVSQFQKEFNEVADDLRDDEETRGELHQRIDDLRERLWSICDERKENAENEREAIINDGWLDDHTGLLANHYITQMQAEVDRFQDTVRMLKDYYRGMEGKIPDPLPADYARIPLIELPIQAPEVPEEEEGGEGGMGGEGEGGPTTPGEELRSSKSNTPSAGKKKKDASDTDMGAAEGEGAEIKQRIPLIPRRPVSPDPNAAKGKDKAKAKPAGQGKEAGGTDETPLPPEDIDEKLLADAHQNGYSAIDKIIASEQAAKEAEEAAEREREAAKELEKQKAAAATKGKGGKDKKGKKSRSPSPKKGKGKDTPPQPTPPPPEEESEEQKEKKKIRERAKLEFFAAIHEESAASKVRLDLVKNISMLVLQDLRSKADVAYKDMNDWLGARFLKEMESIDAMSEILRDAVERSCKLKEEVILVQEDFIVNEDVKVLRTPSPKARPPASEAVGSETFSVEQLQQIYQQFALTAPTGSLSIKSFQDVLFDLAALSQGMEQVPDFWINLTPEKLELMSAALSSDGEYVDWRTFLLAAAQPWPQPTQSQLLDTLEAFKEMDSNETGFVTREQYDRVELWFRALSSMSLPSDTSIPPPFDRLGAIKSLFFDVFADNNQDPAQLDYTNLLLYLSVHPDTYEGFLRALSVAAGKHMPRIPKPGQASKKHSRAASQASLALSMEMEAAATRAASVADKDEVGAGAGAAEDIPEDAITATVPLDSLVGVLAHGQSMRGDSHRFSTSTDPDDVYSKEDWELNELLRRRERLAGVYQELGATSLEPLPFCVLMEHPIIQDVVEHCSAFKATDLKAILSNPPTENTDTQSLKTE